jgi:hypothetical protein
MSVKNPKSVVVDIGLKSCGNKLADNKFLSALAEGTKDGAKLRKCLFFVMKDFAPYTGDFLFDHRELIELPNLPQADMVFLTLVNIFGNSYSGKFEKVAWSVAFCYKAIPFIFSLQKFGLRLYHHKSASPSFEFSKEMLRALCKAIDIVGKLMEPFVLEQIAAGNVTLANSFPMLNNMYQYFRQQAEKNFKFKSRSLPLAFQRETVACFNTNAMIDAYFSRFEHLLVILLIFVNYDREKRNLKKVISDFWSEKFKMIFNLKNDIRANSLYDRLIQIREQIRNPIAHGNFQKDGKSLYFHFFPMGAISCRLSSSEASQNFLFTADRSIYNRACALFDEVDRFLEEGVTKYGFLYAKSGLNVAYDEKSIDIYRKAATDDDKFNEFLEDQSCISAMDYNMDW